MPLENIIFSVIFAIAIWLFVSSLVNRRKREELRLTSKPDQPKVTDVGFGLGSITVLADSASRFGAVVFRWNANDLEARLRKSGWRYRSAADFYASKVLNAVVMFVMMVLVSAFLSAVVGMPLLIGLLLAIAGGAYGLFLADLNVEESIQLRRRAIYREMAWLLSSLVVLMKSGIVFSQALTDLQSLDKPDHHISDRPDDPTPPTEKEKRKAASAKVADYLSRGTGGLFMALLRQMTRDLRENMRAEVVVDNLRRATPDLPELETFFRLVVQSEKGTSISEYLDTLARSMQDSLLNDIEKGRQRANGTLAIVTGLMAMVTLIVMVGPVLFVVFNYLR